MVECGCGCVGAYNAVRKLRKKREVNTTYVDGNDDNHVCWRTNSNDHYIVLPRLQFCSFVTVKFVFFFFFFSLSFFPLILCSLSFGFFWICAPTAQMNESKSILFVFPLSSSLYIHVYICCVSPFYACLFLKNINSLEYSVCSSEQHWN